jgi:molecular chaperone DnaJ
VKLRTLQACERCGGSGAREGTGTEVCRTCGGVGEVRQTSQSFLGQFISVTACPACNGEGSIIREVCEECRGEGRTRREHTVDIDIPPGVASGNYLTMRGYGQAGPRGGPAGDLVVVIEVEDDPRFERHGDDLLFDLPVSFSQAALGAEFDVPTPVASAKLEVPAGTQTGAVFTLRGLGLPTLNTGRLGDLHVRVNVWTPQKLPRETEDLFRKLREVEGEPPSVEKRGRGLWDRMKEALGG